jgi:D-alanyl-D-alanine carboxypeptidase/D-alanyl-D-alanine-endopeptidase (penicillin-binding protein 4)
LIGPLLHPLFLSEVSMPRFRRGLLVALFCLLATLPAHAGDDLATKIEAVLQRPEYRQAHWGILVVDAKSGETVYDHNAEQLFIPASTTKLYSCATALAELGPDYKFETPVYYRGPLSDGRLRGDLILVASGDLTLGGRTTADGKMAFTSTDHIYANGGPQTKLTDTDPLAGLKDLAKQVAAAGVRRVDGDVLVDDRLFAHARGSGSGPDQVTPIVVNDNLIDLIVTPGVKAGAAATVQMRPETSFLQMDAQVTTVAEGKDVRLHVEAVGPQRFVVRGQIAVKDRPRVVIYPVDDPTAFARALFIECLRREGVTIQASLLQPPQEELPGRDAYDRLTRIAKFRSPPFSEVIKVTLKVSHNLYASALPLLVAAKHGQRTLADGLSRQRRFLAEVGVDVDTISFGGGAGGANADWVTPRTSVQLLRAMAKRPEYAVYHEGLPVLGIDGTLADMVPADSPAKGKAQAKTGTLYWHDTMNNRAILTSKALAGTLTTAKGRELVVALYVNGVPLPNGVTPTREGKALGHLCEIIYQNAP